ncbi:uncharacterized protein [Aegilops tauschii subsp. strangulata]|uniref:uncharacterized protein n=1 Tax=Aegilops tauschii subsp. strangulata TaxID=200361 RepID=UPI003CC8DA64
MQKDDLWTELKANFTLPPEEDPEKPVKEQLIKSHALKKMADLFRRWKNGLKTFVDKEETPEFIGKYEKIRDHWPTFVAHKISEKSKKLSATNKKNAAKKKLHHRTGSGGYLKARPKWAKAENDLLDKGIEPETMDWPDRCRTWFFGAGGTLDPVSGKCIWTDEQMRIPVKRLQHYIDAAHQGTFVPDRENDELTMALGNPEHPGRTRGTPGSVPWKAGFPDAGGYKCQERRKKVEQTQIQKLHERVQALEERDVARSNRPAETTPEATPPSQRRSSVASTELLQLEHVLTDPASYPVDAITESQHCHLMTRWENFKVKAAVGSVRPPEPGATFHCRPIPEGYARVMVDEITEGFEDLQLDHPTGEGETRLGSALKTPCLWRKELINLPNWTPPASKGTPPPPPASDQGTQPPSPARGGTPPPPPASDQGTQPPSSARGGTPPPSPPAPARPSSQPPPSPPRQQGRKRPAAAPARRSHSPPPRKQGKKTAAAAPSALPASSSTARGGRQYRFGPSLKTPEKLPYERTEEETTKNVRAEVTNFFEGVKAKKHPPPEEKVDPVKAKRTLAALTKPPKSPPRGNYERIIAKTFVEAERSGSTVNDQRLKERRAGKKIAQLGEQANKSCPPLKVSSNIVANDPRMVAGYSNLGDYLPDDVHYDFLEVDEHKYHYGKPLVKDERSLTTMMRRLHDWYMKTCRESGGRDTLMLRVKEEHDLVGIELLNVPFEEFFQFFNQKALDKSTVTCYCLLKIAELKKRQIGDIGFINTNLIDATEVKCHAENTEANLLRSLVINENKDIILFPYNFNFHYILLEIKLE